MSKITINDFARRAYKHYINAGLTPAGACGLMGNQYAESAGFIANRVEFLLISRLKQDGKTYTDESYTDAVDAGKISREKFLRPRGLKYGYGLCQWTTPIRKAGLYDLARQRGVSIGDETLALDYTLQELRDSYPKVLRVLQSAKTVREASDYVLQHFECPNNWQSMRGTRADYGQQYYDYFTQEDYKDMTEAELRQKVVDTAKAWLGCRESDGSHRKIIDLYNKHKPLARGYAVRYTDAWCATFVSAVAIKLGLTGIMPTECGCGEMIRLYAKIGRWMEQDNYVPEPGDIIMYDWDDTGKGDCTGEPEHVGIVVSVSNGEIKVIEGNKNDAVAYRTLAVNGRHIRGYCLPDYASKAGKVPEASTQPAEPATAPEQPAKPAGGTSLNKTPKWVGAATCNGLNVRTYAGTEYPCIKSWPKLNKGNLVDVCDSVKATDGATWYYVRIAGKIFGFVHSKYIRRQ